MKAIRFAAVASVLFVAGCAGTATKGPMEVLVDRSPCTLPPDTLIVLLPGRYDRVMDFVRHDFVRAVRVRGIVADVAMPDAHFGYYADRSIVDRLLADVIEPARRRGIAHIWLAGISLGGLGALLTAQEHRAEIAGIVAIAPYLGKPDIANEVKAAGGLAAWPGDVNLPADDDDRRLWTWLKLLTRSVSWPVPDALAPPLYLGYGGADRFVANQRVLAAALPDDRVFTAPGGHDWPVWIAVWERILDAAPLPRDASCAR